jgi:hypothetical protein
MITHVITSWTGPERCWQPGCRPSATVTFGSLTGQLSGMLATSMSRLTGLLQLDGRAGVSGSATRTTSAATVADPSSGRGGSRRIAA